MRPRRPALVLLLPLLALLAPANHAEAATAACKPAKAKTVRYVKRAGVAADLTSLDLYSPSKKCRKGKRAPVVLYVHGGAYQIGDKSQQVEDKIKLFNKRGWVFASINYRLTKPGQAGSAQYPDHFRDVAAAVAWIKRNVDERGGDPKRVALLGHSAGADIVSNVANDPQWLRERKHKLSALRCAGPLDTNGFNKPASGPREQAQWVAAFGNFPDYLTETSMALQVRKGIGTPRTITVVRGNRRRQAVQQGYVDALRAAGVKTTVIDATSLGHQGVTANIGAAGDTVMTPPLMKFLKGCF